jgi:hypothetical protein
MANSELGEDKLAEFRFTAGAALPVAVGENANTEKVLA